MFPGKDRNLARVQPGAGETPEEAAERHFLPMYDVLTSPLVKIVGANACPTVTATPETVKAAFTKENDVFSEHNVTYLDPILNFADRKLFAHQMLQAWEPLLGFRRKRTIVRSRSDTRLWTITTPASGAEHGKSWINLSVKTGSAS